MIARICTECSSYKRSFGDDNWVHAFSTWTYEVHIHVRELWGLSDYLLLYQFASESQMVQHILGVAKAHHSLVGDTFKNSWFLLVTLIFFYCLHNFFVNFEQSHPPINLIFLQWFAQSQAKLALALQILPNTFYIYIFFPYKALYGAILMLLQLLFFSFKTYAVAGTWARTSHSSLPSVYQWGCLSL